VFQASHGKRRRWVMVGLVVGLVKSQLLGGTAIRAMVEFSSWTCAHPLWQKLLCRRVERGVLLVRVAALVLLWVSHVAHVWAGRTPSPTAVSDKQSQQQPTSCDWVAHHRLGNPTPPAVKPPTIPLFTSFTAKSPLAQSHVSVFLLPERECGQVDSRSSFGSEPSSDEWLKC